jgi:hypothetical protein
MYQFSQNSYRNLFARICTSASNSPRALCMSTVFVVDPCQSRDRPVPARAAGSERNIPLSGGVGNGANGLSTHTSQNLHAVLNKLITKLYTVHFTINVNSDTH